MEDFLKDYVEMMAETREIEVSSIQLQEIVNNLMDNEMIWDILDEQVNCELEELEELEESEG